jgi:tetratricopeptide (TPR) repeat protein
MTFEDAQASVLSHLRARGKASNYDLIELLGGDESLFQRIRQTLILDDLAEDYKGAGLAYVASEESTSPDAVIAATDEAAPTAGGPEGGTGRIDTGRYDLFISYAHADDTEGTVTALVEEIKARQRRIDGQPMRIFFDREDIRDMNDWEMRILTGLRESRVMIAMLSPAYFDSKYCRKEWEWFADHETERAMTGEAIAPIYTIKVPGFDTDPEDIPDDWKRNLKRRQYLDARPWWTEGAEAFAKAEIRERLEELDRRCYEKVRVARHLEGTRSTIPPHNPMFVGRGEQIREIQVAFTKPGPSLVALHGLGGMGKSVLAHEYAHVHAPRYRAGRFLLPAEGKSDLKTLITSLATDLELTLTDEERKDPDLAHRRVCTALTKAARDEGGPALVLLDNVDDPRLLTRAAVSAALPPPDVGHVIATTRLGEDTLNAATCLEVGALPTPDATRLLAKHRPFSGEVDPAAARAAAEGIAERLGGYPLAVEVAAVYLRETPEVSYGGFLGRLKREGLGAVEGVGQDTGRVQLARHPETLVSALLAPTLAGLSDAEALAVEYAAALPPDAVAVPWLRALVTAEQPGIIPETKPGYPDPWQTLVTRRLRGLRLLSDGEHPKVMRMHRVVQEVVRDRMGAGHADDLREQVLTHAQTRAEAMQDTWTEREARWELTPLVRTTEAALQAGREDAPRLVSFVQSPLGKLGRLQEAKRLLELAIAQGEQTGRQQRGLASNYSNLATIEQTLGRFEPARELMLRAIRIWEAVYEEDHPTLATSYNNLAQIEQDLGQLEEARRLTRKAIAMGEEAFDADHPELAIRYSNLALIEQALGRFEPARELMLRAIRIWEAVYEEDHPTLATSYSNLATIEQDLGRLESARKLMQKAIQTWEAIYDEDHPTLARGYNNLAMIEKDLGHLEVARELMQQAIQIGEAIYDEDHPTLARGYNNLAMIEKGLGRFESAHKLMRQAIQIEEAIYDEDHPTLATSYSNLATIEQDLGRLESARERMQKAIQIFEAVYDQDHPALARSYSNLAGIEKDLGRQEVARERMQQAIQIQEAVYDENHPTLAIRYSGLAMIEQDLGRLEVARERMQKAIQIFEAVYDQDHPALATSYFYLATIEKDLGHLESAREWMQRALAIREDAFGRDHSQTLGAARELADLTRQCGRFDEAATLWERYVGAKQTSGGVSYDGHLVDAFKRAKLDLNQGLFDEAIRRIEPVLDKWTTEHGPDHLWVAVARGVQARALHGLGHHGDALRVLQDIRPVFEAEYGAEHEHVGFLCREIARVLLARGETAAAQGHAEAARRMQESALPAEHYHLADTYHLLGQIEEMGGDEESAAAWMEKAYAIRSAHTPEHPKTTRLHEWLTGRDLPPEADPA